MSAGATLVPSAASSFDLGQGSVFARLLDPLQSNDKNDFSASSDTLGRSRRDRHLALDLGLACWSAASPPMVPGHIPVIAIESLPWAGGGSAFQN